MPGKGFLIPALIALCVGAATGWYIKSQFEAANRTELLENALVQQREAVKQAIAQSEEIRTLDNVIIEQVTKKGAEVREKIRYITKEVTKYVPVKTSCDSNYSVGAVSLLNDARRLGATDSVPRVPHTASLSDEALRAASTHTQQNEIAEHIALAAQYNELSIRHDALIDWLNQPNAMTKGQ
jgi:hypothetical protein